MVAEGLGVALLPTSAVADAIAAGRLRVVEIRGAKRLRSQIFAIRRERTGADLLIAEFLAVARAARSASRSPLAGHASMRLISS